MQNLKHASKWVSTRHFKYGKCQQNKTIEKSYSNPASLELFEERLGLK